MQEKVPQAAWPWLAPGRAQGLGEAEPTVSGRLDCTNYGVYGEHLFPLVSLESRCPGTPPGRNATPMLLQFVAGKGPHPPARWESAQEVWPGCPQTCLMPELSPLLLLVYRAVLL